MSCSSIFHSIILGIILVNVSSVDYINQLFTTVLLFLFFRFLIINYRKKERERRTSRKRKEMGVCNVNERYNR
jgi:uncharacterized membrane protein YfcA